MVQCSSKHYSKLLFLVTTPGLCETERNFLSTIVLIYWIPQWIALISYSHML
jgi:hypothetical protein